MKKLLFLLITPVLFTIAGCASNLMKPSTSEAMPTPSNGKATVVFMRSSIVAGAIGVEMFEIENGKLKFIGALPNGNKFAHQTTPGRKVYMAYGQAADFMIADVQAGKTYYSIVRPNWGTGGFAPTPIRKANVSDYNMHKPDFADWTKSTKPLELKQEDAAVWFEKNKAKYEEIYKTYWARFQTKSATETAARTLRPEDGVVSKP
jgi:hypothetical protein